MSTTKTTSSDRIVSLSSSQSSNKLLKSFIREIKTEIEKSVSEKLSALEDKLDKFKELNTPLNSQENGKYKTYSYKELANTLV